MQIGVLALQGDFAKHIQTLHQLGVEATEVRTPSELKACKGLIIPGGESTTLLRQINFMKMRGDIVAFGAENPIFGTCAGLILMSSKVLGNPMEPLGFLDIEVERNAYGRQVDSFLAEVDLASAKKTKKLPAIFIRAPRIKKTGKDVSILASFNGEPVLVKQGKHLGAAYHPELTGDTTVHALFLQECKA